MGVTYTEPNTKLEFDFAIGVTFSAPNPATDYKNGDDFIWDWAIGKKSMGWKSALPAMPINS
jgi:hypothetical protein